jgi:hypothetical protein
MQNLIKPTPHISFIQYLIDIRDSKKSSKSPNGNELGHKTMLTLQHQEILSRYLTFEKAVQDRTLQSLQKCDKLGQYSKALRSCYDGNTKGIRKVKKLIASSQPARLLKYCPMCSTTLPNTHDHYLPASSFPEYSVHPLNLIPCCSTCNSIKDDGWLDDHDRRLYLHLYSDFLPECVFLRVSLLHEQHAAGVGASFSLHRPPDIAPSDWSIIESHFKNLHLIERYTEQSNDEIAEILADCGAFLIEGGRNAARFLERRASERASTYGENNWRVVLMRELAKSPNLGNWISTFCRK